MKRNILIIAVLMLLSQVTFAQTSFRIGLNAAKVTLATEGSETFDILPVMGLNLGVSQSLGKGVVRFKPGLMLNGKGYAVKVGESKGSVNIYYLDLPLNLAINVPISDNALEFEVGPYVGFGLFGQVNSEGEKESVEFGKDVNRLDGGINLGANYQFGSFGAGVGYQLGFMSIIESNNSGVFNRLLNLNFCYYLGK